MALAAAGCVVDAPPPDLGPCSVPPDRLSWEYGEVGIGTCLASPSDLRVRPDPLSPDNHFVFVVNSDARSNFTGSSLLAIDASSIDLGCPVNGMHEVLAWPLPMQEFAGRVDFDPSTGLALVTDRHVGGFEGELSDAVFVIDASDPRAMRFSDAAPRRTGPYGWIRVAADPWSVRIDPTRGRAWVLGLTDHLVFALDLVQDPIAFVDLRGERQVGDALFEDLDGSGSAPDFRLVGINEALIRDETLSLTYIAGTTRLYFPAPALPGAAALYQADSGDGVSFEILQGGPVLRPLPPWASGGMGAVSVARSDDGLLALVGGAAEDGRRAIGLAATASSGIDWSLGASPVVEPTAGGWDSAGVFDPDIVRQGDDDWHVWHAGGAGLGTAIGHLRGSSLDALERQGDALLAGGEQGVVLLPEAGGWDSAAVFAPSAVLHGDTGQWLMYYAGHADGTAGPGDLPEGLAIGLARSDDGVTWVREDRGLEGDSRILLPGEAGEWDSVAVTAPSVFYDGGRFQMWYQGSDGEDWATGRATSVDGLTWTRDARNPVFEGVLDGAGLPQRAFAFKASAGGIYQVEGPISGVAGEPAWEGQEYTSTQSPVMFEVIGGQALGRGEADALDESGSGAPGSAAGDVVLYVGRKGSLRRLAAARDVGAGLERLGPVVLSGFEADLAGLNGEDPSLPVDGIEAVSDGQGGIVAAFHTNSGIAMAGGVLASDGSPLALAAVAPGIVLAPGEAGQFDVLAVRSPSLVVEPSGTWRMYYEGVGEETHRIGLATSLDGITWSKQGVVLDRGAAGAWDDDRLAAPSVVFDGTTWHMWYAGGDGEKTSIGHATSADGLAWARHLLPDGVSAPVLEAGELAFAMDAVSHPSVRLLPDGFGFEMWFEGRTGGVSRVGHASSADGDVWTPILNPTTAGDRFALVTRAGDDDPSSGIELGDDRSAPRVIDGFPVHGAGASEMILSPDGRLGIVANKRSPDLLVVDLADDSEGGYVDANYGDIEAVLRVPQQHGFAGMRDMEFDSRGRLWALVAPQVAPGATSEDARYGMEGLVQVNWDLVVAAGDRPEGSTFTDGTVLSFVPLARGVEEDEGYATEVSVGPSALAINRAGDRAYVVNYNDNSLYIVDIDAGARGRLVAITDTLDENPWEVALSPDEKLAYVANYYGIGDVPAQHSTIQVVDVDEDSPTFGRVRTRLSNVESRSDRGCD